MTVHKEYVDYLKSGFYKCLCLFEEKNEGLTRYIDSLSYKVYGTKYSVEQNKKYIIDILLSTLEHFYDDSFAPEPDIDLIRSEVFHCINLVDKMFEVGEK